MSRVDEYNHRYTRFSSKMERMIILVIVLFMAVLLVGEILQQYAPIKGFLCETERLEGVSPKP